MTRTDRRNLTRLKYGNSDHDRKMVDRKIIADQNPSVTHISDITIGSFDP
jgi:hypothetical protein